MPSIDICECRFRLSDQVNAHEAPLLRAFFDETLEQQVLSFARDSDGNPAYEYPRIQFKVFQSMALLLGINEGSRVVQKLFHGLDVSQVGNEKLEVVDAQWESRVEEIAVTDDPVSYRFLTPWLALNQKNFQSYTGSRNQRYRKDELSRILTGNCLGMINSLDISFKEWISAACGGLTSIKTSMAGKGMIGFVGTFQLNLRLPDYLGLGKSVARGFGAIDGVQRS